jgi:hypothetical protein
MRTYDVDEFAKANFFYIYFTPCHNIGCPNCKCIEMWRNASNILYLY